ncbi:hypothetical protein ABTX60_06910 [Streptomyces sp. NPDC126510]|uniref:hypothetical protein n=1 Tax=Streptomyces sp. NPDC126510 TaxID=3155317 RepID=UPI00333467ED
MSSTHTERPAYDNRQAAAAHQLGQIIDAVDTARAVADETKPKVWHFASSTDAHAAADKGQVKDRDILVVESERVVGFVVIIRPVAITDRHGAFHPHSHLPKPAREFCHGDYAYSAEQAEQIAIDLGYALADPVAAEAARIATGKPVPIEIPRLLVEPGDILFAFGARLRVHDTGTRIDAEIDASEWWAEVSGATAEDSRRTYRGRWSFAVPVETAAWDIVTVERILDNASA